MDQKEGEAANLGSDKKEELLLWHNDIDNVRFYPKTNSIQAIMQLKFLLALYLVHLKPQPNM